VALCNDCGMVKLVLIGQSAAKHLFIDEGSTTIESYKSIRAVMLG